MNWLRFGRKSVQCGPLHVLKLPGASTIDEPQLPHPLQGIQVGMDNNSPLDGTNLEVLAVVA